MNWPEIGLTLLCSVVASTVGVAFAFKWRKSDGDGNRISIFDDRRFEEKLYQAVRRLEWPLVVSRETYEINTFPQEKEKLLRALCSDAQSAIGLGLLTKEDVAQLAKEGLSQSDLAFGLIFPVSLILFAVTFRMGSDRIALGGVGAVAVLSSATLFIVGMKRRYAYRLAMQSLIFGRIEKQRNDRFLRNTEVEPSQVATPMASPVVNVNIAEVEGTKQPPTSAES